MMNGPEAYWKDDAVASQLVAKMPRLAMDSKGQAGAASVLRSAKC